ncbi:DUF882 domain-containing protein [Oricola nitratireducens]|uniref:DUF882 domain-containing protein n=1 Tax=Oricola nitratireducens TaxID=2775868 RepID=UPI001FEE8A62|nr:DUF882 domain-containing protein [Oricola nitratireducens]
MHTAVRMIAFSCVVMSVSFAAMASASAETRTLKLYFIHTGERAEITFKKDGKYIPSGLNKLNRFLRDWRRNEPTKMDPQLFDIIWEAYQMSGSRDYIHVVSGYRSPATNEMLRRTRGGQAKKSQHMLGKAMDFFIPGVKLSRLREIGFKLQGGGVGYYPKSGSPFVHFDTGNVRAWPRMSRDQLVRIFPDGKTLHLPPDGKPLPGYQQALASYQARKKKGQATAIASLETGRSGKKSGGLLANLFGGGADEEEDNVEAAAPVARATSVIRSEPQPQPEPVEPVETPGTLIAALAPRETPLPQFAPRPEALVPAGQPQQELIASASPQTAPVPPADIPLPDSRPPVLLASADRTPLTARRSAAEIEAALNAAARAPSERAPTVEALIASASRAAAPAKQAMRIPLPSPAPRPEPQPEIAVASLEEPSIRDQIRDQVPAPLAAAYAPPTPGPRPAHNGDVQLASLPAEEDPRVIASYDTGVATTEKSPRPALATASTQRDQTPGADIVPVDEINPSRFGSWMTAQLSVTDHGRASERPIFIRNALREAPTEVYIEGFRKFPTPDPRRFSGKAVTFLAVAKFSGGSGGDGQPLTLQIPLTN